MKKSSNLKKRKRPTKTGKNLETGDLILALNRLFGAKRATKISLSANNVEVRPILSCAVTEIMKLKEKRSLLLNSLAKDSVFWCHITENDNINLFGKCAVFETYCVTCSKVIKIIRTNKPAVSGVRQQMFIISYEGTTFHEFPIYALFCLECKPQVEALTKN
jgi:hypothetical protein